MTEAWRYPDRVELFSEIAPGGERQFVVIRIEPKDLHLLAYYGASYEQAILIAEDLALSLGIEMVDRVSESAEVGDV